MAENDDIKTGRRLLWGFALFMVALFLGFSIFSYDWRDVSLLCTPPNTPPLNIIGPFGAWSAFLLFMAFGAGAYLIAPLLLVMSLLCFFNRHQKIWPQMTWIVTLLLSLVCMLEIWRGVAGPIAVRLNIMPDCGGLIGRIVMRNMLIKWFSPVGAGVIMTSLLVISAVMLIGWQQVLDGLRQLHAFLLEQAKEWRARAAAQQQQAEATRKLPEAAEPRRASQPSGVGNVRKRGTEKAVEAKAAPAAVEPPPAPEPKPTPAKAIATPEPIEEEQEEPTEEELPVTPPEPAKPRPREKPAPPPEPKEKPEYAAMPPPQTSGVPYQLPPLSLLQPMPDDKHRDIQADTDVTSRILKDTLKDFDIEVEITHIEQGPVVTRYELLPAKGVKLERINALSNNLALALKATSIRVQAPIPGKGVVGVEIPNTTAKMVCAREILEGDVWQSGRAKLPLMLGKDVSGNDLVADLTSMPHLLIAGATGSGKTVCMNSILIGLLMSKTPEQLRLLLVDPKFVEFTAYNTLPHLVIPVINEARKVASGLRWAMNEMEKRYRLFAKVRVRNIDSYNERPVAKQGDLFAGLEPAENPEPPLPARLPYIVIIIDELADLMMDDNNAEIETTIARLAQKSRATGIHMILATQRPSVDVITGTIKANIPARIAFQVAQKNDSRTILDAIGADKLLGRGDMLFQPPGANKLTRAQGSLISDADIETITRFIAAQGRPSFVEEAQEKVDKPETSMDDGVDDEIIRQAVDIIRETRRASTSSLQRRLRIGYTRAARVVDILEERGIVGPPRGAEPREILIDLDGQVPDNPVHEEGL